MKLVIFITYNKLSIFNFFYFFLGYTKNCMVFGLCLSFKKLKCSNIFLYERKTFLKENDLRLKGNQ